MKLWTTSRAFDWGPSKHHLQLFSCFFCVWLFVYVSLPADYLTQKHWWMDAGCDPWWKDWILSVDVCCFSLPFRVTEFSRTRSKSFSNGDFYLHCVENQSKPYLINWWCFQLRQQLSVMMRMTIKGFVIPLWSDMWGEDLWWEYTPMVLDLDCL
jgi:hypothetical protein